MDSREHDSLIDYLPYYQLKDRSLVFSFYIYVQFIFADMDEKETVKADKMWDEKETVKADKMCSLALAYFYAMAQIRNREHSIEMLFSKGHITQWTLGQDNWAKFVPFPLDDLDIMN
jgi:hypothetical protein